MRACKTTWQRRGTSLCDGDSKLTRNRGALAIVDREAMLLLPRQASIGWSAPTAPMPVSAAAEPPNLPALLLGLVCIASLCLSFRFGSATPVSAIPIAIMHRSAHVISARAPTVHPSPSTVCLFGPLLSPFGLVAQESFVSPFLSSRINILPGHRYTSPSAVI